MTDLNELFYFVQVVDHGGFAAAARALGLPKSKLSRRIALLEERLGVRLIQRSTRRFLVTEIGQSYYAHCKAMVVEAEAAQEAVELTRAEPCGTVKITTPVALLHTHVGVMLADFMVEHPRVAVQLEATNRRVDVISEGVDLAIRVRYPPLDSSDLALKVLAQRTQCLSASPSLTKKYAAITVPADLSGLPSLDLGPAPAEHRWQLEGPGGAQAEIPHHPRLITDDMIALRTAAVAGVGIVQLPTMMVREEIRQGLLLHLVPEWAPKRHVIHAVFPSKRGLLPAVRALIDYLALRFQKLDEV